MTSDHFRVAPPIDWDVPPKVVLAVGQLLTIMKGDWDIFPTENQSVIAKKEQDFDYIEFEMFSDKVEIRSTHTKDPFSEPEPTKTITLSQ